MNIYEFIQACLSMYELTYTSAGSKLLLLCFMHAPHLSDSCDDKDCTPRPRTIVAAEQTDKMQNDAKEKGWDVTTKMATLKKIMKGATTPFVFKEDVPEQPRRRPNRVARSGR